MESVSERDPFEVLTSIGLTGTESRAFMRRVETKRREQTRQLFLAAKKSSTWLRRVVVLFWAYSLVIWLYVIAMQLYDPAAPYWPIMTWLPLRMDYIGELAFALSFILGFFAIAWSNRQAQDVKRLGEPDPATDIRSA